MIFICVLHLCIFNSSKSLVYIPNLNVIHMIYNLIYKPAMYAVFHKHYLLAPVQTIFPELKMSAVVRGSLILMITAANRLGLYSAFLACRAIFFKSNFVPKFTVQTIFLLDKKKVYTCRHSMCD